MIKITKEDAEQLMANGLSDEDVGNIIATVDPAQKYSFLWDMNGKILFKNINLWEIADYLVYKYRICSILGALHVYESGIYTYLSDDDLDRIIISETYNSTISKRKEIYRYILARVKRKTPSNERYTLFTNGIYDIKTGEVLPPSPDFIFCNRIPHNYIPNAEKQEVFDDFINSLACGDKDVAKLLKQMIGYCFYRKNPLQEFFFLLGSGGNGKSTFLKFVAFIMGAENVSYLTLSDLSNGFNVPLLKNRLLNIGDDVEGEYLENVSILKRLVSGEEITAAEKFKRAEPLIFRGKLLLSGNKMPKTSDKSDGVKRRTNIVPLFNKFTKSENRKFDILEELQTKKVAEYCICVCMKELQEVLRNKCFIKPDVVKAATWEYQVSNNVILEFIEENADAIAEKDCQTVFTIDYLNFCMRCGYKPLGRNGFYERMADAGYKKVQEQSLPGKPYIFKKMDN